MTQDEPVRLLLAEDQVMIREALAALLSFEGDIEVVAQVGRGDEVLKAAEATKPDVAVLDIEMPGMDGLTAAAELKKRSPDTKIVILTTFGRPGFLPRASATCSRPPPTAGPSPRSPPSSTSPRARYGITCPQASRRPGPGTAPRH